MDDLNSKLTRANLCRIPDEPMGPIEKLSPWCTRFGPHGRYERLYEAQNRRCQSERRVKRFGAPGSELDEYNDDGDQRQYAGNAVQERVPLDKREGKNRRR